MPESGTARENIHGANLPSPRTLMEALGEIQQIHVSESMYEDGLQKETVTTIQLGAFASVGLKSATWDVIIWITGNFFGMLLLHLIVKHYLTATATDTPFGKVEGHPLVIFMHIASYSKILFSTVICFWMGKYYAGIAAKRAINAVWWTRFVFIISLSLLFVALFSSTAKFITNEETARFISFMFENKTNDVYEFLLFVHRLAFETSIEVVLVSIGSVLASLISFFFFKVKNRRERELQI